MRAGPNGWISQYAILGKIAKAARARGGLPIKRRGQFGFGALLSFHE